jgi:ABC-2 type transport system ATP-binding protein
MIELLNFTKRYGDLLAVDSLNLKIEPGEMFGFIGPNGAGKSTTIRFLATLLKATGGEGIVNGHRVRKDPLAVRRSVGYMPDNFGVYDGMKVWQFLDFFAVAYRIPRHRRRQVVGDVLDLLDLTVKRESLVNSLSRGMKQRLCLAKTLVHDPPVLILDEPASGLDPRARVELKALLK